MTTAEIKTEETTAVSRPIVLLDVDGVINFWGVDAPAPEDVRKYRTQVAEVWIVPETLEAVKVLFEKAEVWWCTAWRDLANNYLTQILEIPRLKVIQDEAWARGAEWKYEEVRALLNDPAHADRSFIWIEDFIGSWRNPGTVHLLIDEFGDRIKVIDTTWKGHLTREHLEGVFDG